MPQFPGMNPYLEGYLFPDLHNALASRIRALLTPLLRPCYADRLENYTVQDTSPNEDLGIVYPGVEVLLRRGIRPFSTPNPEFSLPHHRDSCQRQNGSVECANAGCLADHSHPASPT